jgi:hypothetical protein
MEKKLIIVFLIASLIMFAVALVRREREREKGIVSSMQFSYFFLWQAVDNWIDLILYPFVVALFTAHYGPWLGIYYGFCTMVVLTLVWNTFCIFLNNNSEEDWTFMWLFTHMWEKDSFVWILPYARLLKSCGWFWKVRRFLFCILKLVRIVSKKKFFGVKLGRPLGFLLISIKLDSFCAINYLYRKNVNLRDKKVLGLYLLSHVICNAVWLPVAFGISWSAETILKFQP